MLRVSAFPVLLPTCVHRLTGAMHRLTACASEAGRWRIYKTHRTVSLDGLQPLVYVWSSARCDD